MRPLKIFSISEIPTGDENRSEGSVGADNHCGASDQTISPSYGVGRALTRENLFYFNWHHSNNYKPLINWGPDSELTCNVPGLGSKL